MFLLFSSRPFSLNHPVVEYLQSISSLSENKYSFSNKVVGSFIWFFCMVFLALDVWENSAFSLLGNGISFLVQSLQYLWFGSFFRSLHVFIQMLLQWRWTHLSHMSQKIALWLVAIGFLYARYENATIKDKSNFLIALLFVGIKL